MRSRLKFFRESSLCLRAGLIAAALGSVLLLGSVRPASADLSLLHQFTGQNGSEPHGLIQGSDGNFYGTTVNGGSKGDGTVFMLTPQGALTKLVNFNSKNGSYPAAPLIQGSDGSFYGTTAGGGTDDVGTVFRLTTDGTAAGTTLTTLYSFPLSGEVTNPGTALLQAKDGSFYGTTAYGGGSQSIGTLYRLVTDGTPAGTTLTTLFRFLLPGTNGYVPDTPLIQASDDSFYGTTAYGGSNNDGTVFRMTTDGSVAGTILTTLYNFNGLDGTQPEAPLLQAKDGSFYGTTFFGGPDAAQGGSGYGTVFRLTTDGTAAGTTLTSLVQFPDSGVEGDRPESPLLQAGDGSFYGTTAYGGSAKDPSTFNDGDGTVFHLTTDGTAAGTILTTLASFDSVDGVFPTNLILAGDGSFYGTALFGGSKGDGTVFHLTSAPPVIDPVESLTFTPTTVLGGNIVTGEVTLRNIATVPQTVVLASSDSALRVRAFVTITPGHRHALFTAQTLPVYVPVTVTITATGDNGAVASKSAHVLVTPSPLLSLTVTPPSLVGGSADAAGEVALKDIARMPVTVTLTSSDPSVLSVRNAVIVTTGHRHALFTLVSHPVTTPQTVTITAVANGVTKTTTITITP